MPALGAAEGLLPPAPRRHRGTCAGRQSSVPESSCCEASWPRSPVASRPLYASERRQWRGKAIVIAAATVFCGQRLGLPPPEPCPISPAMAVRDIVKLPDPILRQVSKPIAAVDAETRRLLDDMLG